MDWWDDIVDWIEDEIIEPVIDVYDDYVAPVIDTINDWIDDDIWDTGEGVAGFEGWLTDTTEDIITGVEDTVTDIEDAINEGIDHVIDPISNWWDDLFEWGQDVVNVTVDEAGNVTADTVDELGNILTDPEGNPVSGAGGAVETVIEYITRPEIIREFIIEKGKEISLDPLGGILMAITNNVAMRLELWFANALGVSLTVDETEDKEV